MICERHHPTYWGEWTSRLKSQSFIEQTGLIPIHSKLLLTCICTYHTYMVLPSFSFPARLRVFMIGKSNNIRINIQKAAWGFMQLTRYNTYAKNLKSWYVITLMKFSLSYEFRTIICTVCRVVACWITKVIFGVYNQKCTLSFTGMAAAEDPVICRKVTTTSFCVRFLVADTSR